MLISTVIPIGNLAIDFQNLRDIIRQSYTLPIELIFILDTSEDSAAQKLENLCKIENCNAYQILESKGRNPGTSRNLGVLSAKSDWIVFCDSDDLPIFNNIVYAILNTKVDYNILIGSYEIENLRLGITTKQIINTNINSVWESISLNPGLWRWAIKRSFMSDITFPDFSLGEDQYFLIKLLSKKPKIRFSSEIFYRYRVEGRDSLTSAKLRVNDLISILQLEFSQKLYRKDFVRVRNNMINRQILTLFKNGNYVTRCYAIIFFIKFIFFIPPREYLNFIKFNISVFRSNIKK